MAFATPSWSSEGRMRLIRDDSKIPTELARDSSTIARLDKEIAEINRLYIPKWNDATKASSVIDGVDWTTQSQTIWQQSFGLLEPTEE